MKLHKVNRDVKGELFCGPAAVCSITGEKLSDVWEAFHAADPAYYGKHVGKETRIRAIQSDKDLARVMKAFGWCQVEMHKCADRVPGDGVLTLGYKYEGTYHLRDFLKHRGSGGPYVVQTPGHVQAVGFGEFCDSLTSGRPVSIAKAAKDFGRKLVVRWWHFEPIKTKPRPLSLTDETKAAIALADDASELAKLLGL